MILNDKEKYGNNLPVPDKIMTDILEHLAEMSAPYGTKMHIENGIATVILE